DELDILLPASVAMFTEEVGVSPVGADGGRAYRARVNELIAVGRAFARIEDGQVVFKAEIGSVTPLACQVQGVWVRPELRGRGLAEARDEAIDEALRRMATLLGEEAGDILAANAADVASGEEAGLGKGLLDRLRLDRVRIEDMARQIGLLADVPFPTAEVPVRD